MCSRCSEVLGEFEWGVFRLISAKDYDKDDPVRLQAISNFLTFDLEIQELYFGGEDG